MELNLLELSWAAGFLDGEGYFGFLKGSKKCFRIEVAAKQVELEPLQRLHNALMGLGNIRGPFKHSKAEKAKPIYEFRAQTFEEAQAIIALIWKFLSSPKKKAAAEVLKNMHKYHMTLSKYKRPNSIASRMGALSSRAIT